MPPAGRKRGWFKRFLLKRVRKARAPPRPAPGGSEWRVGAEDAPGDPGARG